MSTLKATYSAGPLDKLSSCSSRSTAVMDSGEFTEMVAHVVLPSGRRVQLDQEKALYIDADDGGPVDEHHVDAAAAGGSLKEINARLRACPRPATARASVIMGSDDPEALMSLLRGGVLETSTGASLDATGSNLTAPWWSGEKG